KLIGMQNNTYKLKNLPIDQKLFNGNQLLTKKCSNSWELSSKWAWNKCQKWTITGAKLSYMGPNTMSRDRFELILKFYHFSNNEEQHE
ncbi:unnamed protein product, partial [Adineta ricciae]